MARLVSVQPRHNPYRENPSGLVIGGVIAALAAAGGAGWYFFVREGEDTNYDKDLYNQIEADQRSWVTSMHAWRGSNPNIKYNTKEESKAKRSEVMRNMLNPPIRVNSPGGPVEVGRVSRDEAKAMVAAGTHRWGPPMVAGARMALYPTQSESAETPAEKPAAKKKGKKK